RRADEAAELDELLDLVERSGVLTDKRHDIQRADLRRPAAVLQTDIAAHHPAELDLAVPAGDDARGIEELADLLDGYVGGERLRRIGQLETERAQGRLSRIHAQDPSRPCGEQPRSTSSARLGRTVGKRLAWPGVAWRTGGCWPTAPPRRSLRRPWRRGRRFDRRPPSHWSGSRRRRRPGPG